MGAKFIVILGLSLLATPVVASDPEPQPTGARSEVWLAVTSWPALGDLQPATSGGFDAAGFGLGGAIHWPVRRSETSELLIGIDGFIAATGSNISGVIDDVLARHLFLGGSVKWAIGEARNVQLDAGLGFHLADMAEVSTEYLGIEHEAWEASRVGAYIGGTWDIGAGRAGKSSGLSLSLKVHFVDFGTVHDEDVLFQPLFGADAGELDGPIYLLQIGWAGR
jgi:hypothetical protein